MFQKVGLFAVAPLFAFVILFISLLNAVSPNYVFSQSPSPSPSGYAQKLEISYYLPYPGRVLPDNFLWPVKVIRDRIGIFLNFSAAKKSEALLQLADKRLASAQKLFEVNKSELAVSVLTKAEKYLEESYNQEEIARTKGVKTSELAEKIAKASLKHRQVIEELMNIAPEDAKPIIIQTADYPKRIYTQMKIKLMEMGGPSVESPFKD